MQRKKNFGSEKVLFIGEKSSKYSNNETNRSKHGFWWIFVLTAIIVFSQRQNIYFLIVSLIQVSTYEKIGLLPKKISPTGPLSTAGPLIGTIFIQFALILFNWIRNKWADSKENNTQTNVIEYNFSTRKLEHLNLEQKFLRPGDVVKFKKGDTISVDIVTLAVGKSDNGIATFTATDLTGEPGNIPSKPVSEHLHLAELIEYRARLNCYSTGSDINEFDGEINLGKSETFLVTAENTIPAGAILTSGEVIGVVYAAGPERKSQMVNEEVQVKESRLDKLTGKFMIYNVYVLIFMIIICTALSVFFDMPNEEEIELGIFYVVVRAIQNFMIYNGMIPLSLSINLSIVRILQIYGFAVQSIDCNNSKLTSDLYHVNFIFTDKTGTLTKNEMVFSYLVDRDKKLYEVLDRQELVHGDVDRMLLRCLGLCTTASPIPGDRFNFDAKNQEDLTIIQRSIHLGCELVNRIGNKVTLDFILSDGRREQENYQVLHEFEFSSNRKSMGVIVRELDSNQVFFYLKGAGDVLVETMQDEKEKQIYSDAVHILDKKDNALRNMAAVYREITKEWGKIEDEIKIAKQSLDRETLKKIYTGLSDRLEQDMRFLGIIGIQDELQTGVKSTVKKLKEANMKFAMLTGDRTATAINVARKSGILDNKNYFIIDSSMPMENQLKKISSTKNEVAPELYSIVRPLQKLWKDKINLTQ